MFSLLLKWGWFNATAQTLEHHNVSILDLDCTFHLEPIVNFKMQATSTMVSKITFDSAIKKHYFSQ